MMDRFIVKTGDITKENVCVIVNAANSSLLGGGGVDGAIHRAGGSKILEECKEIRENKYPNGLPTGECVATNAGNLQAKYVIHTVGPIYHECDENCADLLASCYSNALNIAVELGCKDIAFPAISTGIYGYPKDKAAHIAYNVVKKFLEEKDEEEKDEMEVRFIFHNNEDKKLFMKTIQEK